MKKLLLSLLFVSIVSYAAAPAIQESNRIKFTAESQETTTPFRIYSISYVSASGSEVSGTGGFILNDSALLDIAACEATGVSDQCHFNYPNGLDVVGFQVEHLDGGHIFVYGKQR